MTSDGYIVLPQGVMIFVFIVLGIIPKLLGFKIVFVVLPVQEHRIHILPIAALGATDSKAPAVGSGQGGIQGQGDQLATGAADHGFHNIRLGKLCLCQLILCTLFIDDIFVQTLCAACHRSKGQKPVAPVDVQHLANRAKLVGGVIFAVAVQVISQPVVAVFLTVGDLLTQIVVVAAVAGYDLTEQTLFHHIQHHQLPLAVTAVFQHHARHSGALGGIHQLPAILHSKIAADLHTHILSCLHSSQSNLHMVFPGTANDNRIHIHCNNLMIIVSTERTAAGFFFNLIGQLLRSVLIYIANTGNLNSLFMQRDQNTVDQHISSGSAADHTKAYNLFHICSFFLLCF